MLWICFICFSILLATAPHVRAQPSSDPPQSATAQTDQVTQTPPPPPYFWLNVLDPQRQEVERLIVTGAQAFKREHLISALRAFEDAALRAPYITESSLFAGLVAARLKQHERAVGHFERFRAMEPAADSTHDLCFHLAISLSHLQRWEQTIGEYERCLSLAGPQDRSRIIYLGNLGETYMAVGRLDEAIKAYEGALTFDQGLLHALLGLGVALERANDPVRGRRALRAGLLLDPALEEMTSDNVFFIPPGDGYFQLGLMLEELGRIEDARRYYTKFLDFTHAPGGAPAPVESSQGVKTTQNHYVGLGQKRLDALRDRRDALIKTWPSPSSKVTAAVVDSGLVWLALGTGTGEVTLLKIDSLEVLQVRSGGPRVMDLAFTPDAKELRVLLETGEVLRVEVGGKGRVVGRMGLGEGAALESTRRAVSLSADGSAAVVLSGQKNQSSAELWALNPAQPGAPSALLGASALAQSSATMVISPGAEQSRLFSIKGDLGVLQPLGDPSKAVQALPTVGFTDAEFSPDGTRIVAATTRGLVILDGTDAHLQKLLLPLGDPLVQAVSLDASGRYVTAVTRSNLQIWDLSLVVFDP